MNLWKQGYFQNVIKSCVEEEVKFDGPNYVAKWFGTTAKNHVTFRHGCDHERPYAYRILGFGNSLIHSLGLGSDFVP